MEQIELLLEQLSVRVAREPGLTDVEAVTLPMACAAGNYAIGYGADVIRSGDAAFALVGGADAVCRKTFAGFYRLGTIAPERCRPFDADRQGILPGEGAGIVLLESADSAPRRGARIYAEVLGYGLNCDADHPVAPNRDSVARCTALAHRNAGVKPGDIDFISAHGTGTKANDVTKAAAIPPFHPADHQPREHRPRVRPGLRPEHRPRGAAAGRAEQRAGVRRQQRGADPRPMGPGGLRWTRH